MDNHLEEKVRFLREAHTDGMPHSERSLLDHLLGTRRLLTRWEAPPAVCDAGLFHSVYATEHYETPALPLDKRTQVQQLIGQEAEALAWLFCVMRRETFDQNVGRTREFTVQDRRTTEWLPLTAAQFEALVTMTFANTLEAFPRLTWSVRRRCRSYLRPFRVIAIPGAQDAFDDLDARSWEFWK
jgi:Domain of unknown function (DUF6817)